LHFFGITEFDPANSYGSCLVVVPDIETIHSAFAAELRLRYGKLLLSGIARMTRPRKRRNTAGLTGFSIVDPGGNWIRFTGSTNSADNAREWEQTDSPGRPSSSNVNCDWSRRAGIGGRGRFRTADRPGVNRVLSR
jgi:hypothetical protein